MSELTFKGLQTDKLNEIVIGGIEVEVTYPDGRPAAGATYELKLNPGGTSIAATVMEKDADMGRGAVFHDNRVEVERAKITPEEFLRAFSALGSNRA